MEIEKIKNKLNYAKKYYVKPVCEKEVKIFLDTYETNDILTKYKDVDFNKYISVVGQMYKSIITKKYIEKKKGKKYGNIDCVKMFHSGYCNDGLGGMTQYKSKEEFEDFALSGFSDAFHCWEIWLGILVFRPKRFFEWYFEIGFQGGLNNAQEMHIMMKSYCYLKKKKIPVEISSYNIPEIKKFLSKC